jgi:hypothetical protein
VYKLNHSTGSVMWTLGGKHPSFRMGPGTRTAYQHDAVPHPGGLMTIFDNGAWPLIHPQSRVVLERVNPRAQTVTLVRTLHHSPKVIAAVEGSAQLLGNGHVFVGWGQGRRFSEYDRRGRQIYDGRFVGASSSYRTYQFAWDGQPTTPPALDVRRGSAGLRTVYVSWNGATGVRSWRVLAGRDARSLRRIAVARKQGFETAIRVHTTEPDIAVRAIDSAGRVLAQSRVARGRVR